MNASQITNIVTIIIGSACGYFVAQGKMDNSTATKITAGIVALVTFIFAHIIHGAVNSDPTSGGRGQSGKSSALLIAFLLLPLFLLTHGCASAQTNAYKAEAAADVTISAAMTAWGDYVAAEHPPASQEQAVENAFVKFQQTEILAIDATAAMSALQSGANTNLDAATLQQNLSAANADAAQSAADLISLLQSFGVKL